MTSPTLMYSTPTTHQFNKKAHQKSGKYGLSYTTDYNIIYSSSASSIPHLEKQEYPCLLHYLSTIQQATTVTQLFPRLVMICQST